MLLHRILVIDDQVEAYDLVMDVVERLLGVTEDQKVEVTHMDTVADGHQAIERGGWSLIICDICFDQQPGKVMDPEAVTAGLQLVARANEKRGGKGNRPLVIVLTQFSTQQSVATAAREAGADEFLPKRILRRTLAAHFRRALDMPELSAPATCWGRALRWLRPTWPIGQAPSRQRILQPEV